MAVVQTIGSNRSEHAPGSCHNLHICRVGDRTIVLDLIADRYFLLPRDAHAALAAVRAGAALDDHQPGLAPPGNLGLLDPAVPLASMSGQTTTVTPSTELFCSDRSASLAAITWTLIAHLQSLMQERRFSFHDRIRWLRRLKSRMASDRADAPCRLVELMAGFRLVQALLPERDRCLVRSMAVFTACCRAGVRVDLVIGVKLDPFAAHCWVQRGDALVNDHLETVRLYQPILTV